MKNLNSQQTLAEVLAFLRAQLSAFIGGIVDFVVMILLVELVSFHYIPAIALGGTIGAVVNFQININWTFNNKDSGDVATEIKKFALVVMGSIFLKAIGTHILTSWIGIDYKLSRLITDAIVCFGFNYTLQRFWVFRNIKV